MRISCHELNSTLIPTTVINTSVWPRPECRSPRDAQPDMSVVWPDMSVHPNRVQIPSRLFLHLSDLSDSKPGANSIYLRRIPGQSREESVRLPCHLVRLMFMREGASAMSV